MALTLHHHRITMMLHVRSILLLILLNICLANGDPPGDICGTSPIKDEINTASLILNTKGVDITIILQLISKECYTCELQNITYMRPELENCTLVVDTRWPTDVAIIGNSSTDKFDANCTNGYLNHRFEEGGRYIIVVVKDDDRDQIACKGPYSLGKPADSNTTIYVAMGIFAGLAIIWIVYKKVKSGKLLIKLLMRISPDTVQSVDPDSYTARDLGTPTNVLVEKGTSKKERLKSLDTVRGISLVIMMFVNYGGADYWFFSHSKWNGLTVADLVFPWFIWIMGTAMAYSFQSFHRNAPSRTSLFLKILKRSIILFLLGLLVSSSGSQDPVDFKKIRIMGVLQRFSLTYLITATVHMFCTKPTDTRQDAAKWLKRTRDIINYWPEWIIQLMLVFAHVLLTFFLDVPHCPKGYLGPGGLARDGDGSHKDVSLCTGGAAGYIDRQILGDHHVYHSPTCKELYHTTVPYDPEGLLGTLTACFLCFLGLQAGKILILFSEPRARIIRFCAWSVATGAIAALLCKASQNDGWIPVNKNLWSVSYIFAMASMAFALLCFCYVVIDVRKIWSGAPFYYPGMNSIVVYVSHEFFSQPFMSFWNVTPKSHAIYLLVNVMDVGLWVFMSLYLYCKQIFISI